jgi:hypothetical protein
MPDYIVDKTHLQRRNIDDLLLLLDEKPKTKKKSEPKTDRKKYTVSTLVHAVGS